MLEEKSNEELLRDDLKQLQNILDDLNKYQKRQASLRWNFWRGVFYGFGFFIGSVLLTAALVYVLGHLGTDGNSVFGRFIENIVETVEKARN
jgi:hypothetical protein